MGRFLLLGLAYCLLAPIGMVEAHLGETLEECGIRYGEPTLAMKDSVIYKKNGFEIGTLFVNGKVEGVTYKKESKDGFFPQKISLEEIYQILKSNCPNSTFTTKDSGNKWAFYCTEDGNYADYDLIKHCLVIMSQNGRTAFEQMVQKKATAATGGL